MNSGGKILLGKKCIGSVAKGSLIVYGLNINIHPETSAITIIDKSGPFKPLEILLDQESFPISKVLSDYEREIVYECILRKSIELYSKYYEDLISAILDDDRIEKFVNGKGAKYIRFEHYPDIYFRIPLTCVIDRFEIHMKVLADVLFSPETALSADMLNLVHKIAKVSDKLKVKKYEQLLEYVKSIV